MNLENIKKLLKGNIIFFNNNLYLRYNKAIELDKKNDMWLYYYKIQSLLALGKNEESI